MPRQLYVDHRPRCVDLTLRHLAIVSVSRIESLGHSANQCSYESAPQYLFLMLYEDLGTRLHEDVDRLGSQVSDPLVAVADSLQRSQRMIATICGEVAQEQIHRTFVAQDAQLVSVLHIHHLIAYIVSRLHKVDQRVTHIVTRGGIYGQDAQIVRHIKIGSPLRLEVAKLPALRRPSRRPGVLDNSCQRGVGQGKAPGAAPLKLMCQQAKAVGIALEVSEILPRVPLPYYGVIPLATIALSKVSPDRPLATMPEGRIAHIVRQTGRRDDRGDATPMRRILIVRQATRYVVAQTASHAAHLQTMRQAVVHKDILRQGEDLRFVL